MSKNHCVGGCAVGTTLLATAILLSGAGLSQHALGQAPAPDTPAERGRKLFEKVWEPEVDLKHLRDGLGPLFNERSCVACHSLGGVGGAGLATKNVELLTVQIPSEPTSAGELHRRASDLHAGFDASASLVLHRFGTDSLRYAAFRERLLGQKNNVGNNPIQQAIAIRSITRREATSPLRTIKARGITLVLSQRNTPALFGGNLIDAIPKAELLRIADLQPHENQHVSGRFVGRFGWRGQIDKLDEFVKAACVMELGLQLRDKPEPLNPLNAPRAANGLPAPNNHGADLSDQESDELIAFVASLPAPERAKPVDARHAAIVNNGENLFHSVGCTICHRPVLGNVRGIYSDLLLHDMGTALIDPAPAPTELSTAQVMSYGGSMGPIDLVSDAPAEAARLSEWKTPPLWGVSDSAPYLHDGRAETIEQAIAYHGGEASDSADRYLALPADLRENIVAFLSSLKAPQAGNEHPRSGWQPSRDPRQRARERKERIASSHPH